ncbi:unnamed protein product [Rotaria sp. Silwood2]|nr:unnamed protein product [Rotaria sp. Silwood2]
MLKDYFEPAVADWSDLNDFWYQHDGAPAHYSRIAREYLDEMFPDRWMGRRGPIEWPPRMTICPEWYGVGEAVINCGFCGAYVCEECYMRHLAMCGPDDEKQKVDETTKAS